MGGALDPWWKRPGPGRGGGEPKPKEPLPRYMATAFVHGSTLRPAQTVRRHMRGSVVVNAHVGLGDEPVAAVDVTKMDTGIDSLVADTSIRYGGYGGYGGIGHRLVCDTYVTFLFRFVPCGVWEAVPWCRSPCRGLITQAFSVLCRTPLGGGATAAFSIGFAVEPAVSPMI